MKEAILLILQIVNKLLDLLGKENNKYIYINEENLKIDCYDFLKQVTKLNRDITPQKVIIRYIVESADYSTDMVLEAKCNVNSYSAYEFSLASTTLRSYDETECVGYDLNYNSNVEIRPKLISPDSFSKRLSLQLNKNLNKGQILKIRIRYKSYNTMQDNNRYIISGCNYKYLNLNQHTLKFEFLDYAPDNIRVYEIDSFKNTYKFLYKIFEDKSEGVFIDDCEVEKIKRNKKRVYVF